LKEKAELLKTLPESERAVYLEKELESYQMDATQKGVTGQQKFELMQLVILQRAHRLKILAMTSIAIAVVLAVTIIMVWVSGDSITVNKGVAAKGNNISIQNEVHSNE
jgi:cell division protein FtsL